MIVDEIFDNEQIADIEQVNEEIMDALAPVFNKTESLVVADVKKAAKTRNLAQASIYAKVDGVLRSKPFFGALDSVSAGYLMKKYEYFTKLCAEILDKGYILLADKPLICAYLGITTEKFNALEKSDSSNVRDVMKWIGDSIVGKTFAAAQSGTADGKSAMSTLKIKDSGMGLVENDIGLVVAAGGVGELPSAFDLTAQLAAFSPPVKKKAKQLK